MVACLWSLGRVRVWSPGVPLRALATSLLSASSAAFTPRFDCSFCQVRWRAPLFERLWLRLMSPVEGTSLWPGVYGFQTTRTLASFGGLIPEARRPPFQPERLLEALAIWGFGRSVGVWASTVKTSTRLAWILWGSTILKRIGRTHYTLAAGAPIAQAVKTYLEQRPKP